MSTSSLVLIMIAIAVYLLIMIFIGASFMKKNKNSEDYFLGGRSLNGFVAALSAGASDMSGWMLMGLPGSIYALGTGQVWIGIGLALGTIANWVFVAGPLRKYTIKANNSLTLPEFFAMAERGRDITISSMCTVFAESEIVSLMGQGTPREDIARGAVGSVVARVVALAGRKGVNGACFLSGGFCETPLMVRKLASALNAEVCTHPDGRFAGAIGAAILSR